MSKIDVGVLGATGMVGQQFIARLARHPWFRRDVARRERAVGRQGLRRRGAVAAGDADARRRRAIARVEACVPGRGPKVVFSALDANAADELEARSSPPPATSSSATRATTAWIRWCRCSFPKSTPITSRCSPEQRRVKGWTRRHRHQSRTARPSCSRWRSRRCAQFDIRARAWSRRCRRCRARAIPACRRSTSSATSFRSSAAEEEKIESETLKILGTRRRPRAASGRRQRADESRAGHRRPHDDRVGRRSTRSRRSTTSSRRCATFQRPAAGARAADRAAAGRSS